MMVETYKPKIECIDATSYRVYSETNPAAYYITGPNSCTCPDFKFRGQLRDCKHQKALKAYLVEKEIKESTSVQVEEKTHEHRIRCTGCNFRTTIERCTCNKPYDHEFLCFECQGTSPVQEWRIRE
jgi:predicted nucleic acid-binding Zn finger protein